MPLEGIADFDSPPSAITEIAFDGVCEMADIHHDLVEAVSGQMLHQILHDRLAKNRNHGLGQDMSQRAHPRSLACSQDHCFHAGFR